MGKNWRRTYVRSNGWFVWHDVSPACLIATCYAPSFDAGTERTDDFVFGGGGTGRYSCPGGTAQWPGAWCSNSGACGAWSA